MINKILSSIVLCVASVQAQPEQPLALEAEADAVDITYTMRDNIYRHLGAQSINEIGTEEDRTFIPREFLNLSVGDRLFWSALRPEQEGYLMPENPTFMFDPDGSTVFFPYQQGFRYPQIEWVLNFNSESFGSENGCIDGNIASDARKIWSPSSNYGSIEDAVRFYCYQEVPIWPWPEFETWPTAAQRNFTHVSVFLKEETMGYFPIDFPDLWTDEANEPWLYLNNTVETNFVSNRQPCNNDRYIDANITVFIKPLGGNINWIKITANSAFDLFAADGGCAGAPPLFTEPPQFRIFQSADFNADGTENGLDVAEFLNCYINNDPRADLNFDNTLNGLDVSNFLYEYQN